jgi:hypothetical protein
MVPQEQNHQLTSSSNYTPGAQVSSKEKLNANIASSSTSHNYLSPTNQISSLKINAHIQNFPISSGSKAQNNGTVPGDTIAPTISIGNDLLPGGILTKGVNKGLTNGSNLYNLDGTHVTQMNTGGLSGGSGQQR